jgi:hypothetical protein
VLTAARCKTSMQSFDKWLVMLIVAGVLPVLAVIFLFFTM